MEIENLENQTSKLVISKRKPKKRNKNKYSEKLDQDSDHQVKDEEVIANSVSSAATSTTSNDCANKNLDELTDRLHIKTNGLVLTNGDHHHSDDGTKKDRSSSSSNNSSPIKNGDDGASEKFQNSIDPKIESSTKSTNISGSNFVSRKPSDENCKILENGCEINNSKSTSKNLYSSSHNDIANEPSISYSLKPSTSTLVTASTAEPIAEVKLASIEIQYKEYESELQMPDIMRLIQKDLSEPYSIYTYRYFIHNWPKLCFLAYHQEKCVGAIVCKLDMHRQTVKRGYIAMLAVDKEYRKLKIGSNLVQKAIQAMLNDNADEVVLETEITNIPALKLYENLGFVRDKRLFHYYLNGVDALRLKLWFR